MDDRGSAHHPGHGRRIRVELLLLATVALLALMAAPSLWGEVYTTEDLGFFHVPLRIFFARCLATGADPSWCPQLFCGFDLHGEGQIGLAHPWHHFLYRAFQFETALNLEFLISYPATMLGMAWLLRRRGLPIDASLLGGFMAAFGGFVVYHYMHVNVVGVVAHIPFALLAIDAIMRGDSARSRAWPGAALAAITGSQLLLGYPQAVFFSTIIEGLYAASVWVELRGRPRWLTALVCAKVLGLGLGAVQVLPSWGALAESERSAPTAEFLGMLSLPPANTIQWLVPYLFESRVYAPGEDLVPGWRVEPASSLSDSRVKEYGLYNGIAVPVLLAWVLVRWKHLRHRHLAGWAVAVAGLGLVLAFGKYAPIFELTHRLPGFNVFRAPARFVLLVHLASAVLVAVAFADLSTLRSSGNRLSWRRLWPLALPTIGSVAIVASARFGSPEAWLAEHQAPLGALILSVGLVATASGLVVAAARRVSWAPTALAVLIALDLGAYSMTYLASGSRAKLDLLAAFHPVATRSNAERAVFGPGTLVCDNLWMFSGRGLVEGYAGLTPVRRLDYSKPSSRRVASAAWSVGHPTSRLPDPLPRARLVAEARVSDDPNRDLDTIDPAIVALVDRPVTLDAGEPSGDPIIVRDRPGELRVVVDSPGRRLLVISERHHHGWTARVDRQPAEILRAYGDFMAIVVEEGRHMVHLRFQPKTLAAGKAISIASMTLVIAWPIGMRRFRRPRTLGQRAIFQGVHRRSAVPVDSSRSDARESATSE
ncbi:hypothetical protein [Tautonia marina]|uniref:hypothetical protein n=1 Tax=Tautonia marina TaxID=2653855 RepID=UPI0012611F79|nr:hypothetical protein [Tautonia marina]